MTNHNINQRLDKLRDMLETLISDIDEEQDALDRRYDALEELKDELSNIEIPDDVEEDW